MPFDDRIARAVLLLAQEEKKGSLTRTVFVKLFYLLDVLVAEESEGQQFTPWTWRFVHFGPFCQAAIDVIEKDPVIEAEEREFDSGHDGTIYCLRDGAVGLSSLEDLGVPIRARTNLRQQIRRYATDLPALLDFVYFRTEPMERAKPGEVLSFEECRSRRFEEVRPIPFPPTTDDTKRRAKEMIQQAREDRTGTTAASSGPFDDVYYQGLAAIDEDGLNSGLVGRAKIDLDGGDT